MRATLTEHRRSAAVLQAIAYELEWSAERRQLSADRLVEIARALDHIAVDLIVGGARTATSLR